MFEFRTMISANKQHRFHLSQLKKDFVPLGIDSPVLCSEKRDRISRKELVCGFELFEHTAEDLEVSSADRNAAILSLYSGEYLEDFEAVWATAKRIEYQKIYKDALHKALGSSLQNSKQVT